MASDLAADTPSPRGSIFGKLRKGRNDSRSSITLQVHSGDQDDESHPSGATLFPYATSTKGSPSRSGSIDERRGSQELLGRRLSTILTRKRSKSKRVSRLLDRARSPKSDIRSKSASSSANRSVSSLLQNGSGGSSLLTDDHSDTDEAAATGQRLAWSSPSSSNRVALKAWRGRLGAAGGPCRAAGRASRCCYGSDVGGSTSSSTSLFVAVVVSATSPFHAARTGSTHHTVLCFRNLTCTAFCTIHLRHTFLLATSHHNWQAPAFNPISASASQLEATIDRIFLTSKPILETRDSHSGYLTLSAPEVHVQTHPILTDPSTAALSDRYPGQPDIPRIVEPGADSVPPVSDISDNRTTSEPVSAAVAPDAQQVKSGATKSRQITKPGKRSLGGLFGAGSSRTSLDSRSQDGGSETEGTPATQALKASLLSQTTVKAGDSSAKKTSRTRIDTEFPRPSTPPNLAEAPATVVTPPTPVEPFPLLQDPSSRQSLPVLPAEPSRERADSLKHRRGLSATLPVKLSSPLKASLTPPVEETNTPGGTLVQPATGFFSSVFSVAQKAADITTGFGASILPASKSQAGKKVPTDPSISESASSAAQSRRGTGSVAGDTQIPAVATLGKGNLRLSHLGIVEDQSTADQMTSTVSLVQQLDQNKAEQSKKNEQEAAAKAVSSAYEKSSVTSVKPGSRPVSVASNDVPIAVGDQTPPRQLHESEVSLIKRTGSTRSKLSGGGGGRRKHRASSATAGTSVSIATGLKDSVVGLANPLAVGAGHRLTGFAVASSKRNRDFHQLFRSVPEDDYLIEDYSAALQKDILLHGRLYVSEGHISFFSNIVGWVTNLVISFDEVVSIEKKNTAIIFPNAIVISTLHARNIFASFVARDSTYELLIGIWKISHPNLKSSLNGVALVDAGTGDKTEIVEEAEQSASDTEQGSEDEVYDEDDENDAASFTDAGVASRTASEAGETFPPSRKVSANPVPFPPFNNNAGALRGSESQANLPASGGGSSPTHEDFPGPATHTPTECTEKAEHYDRSLVDLVIPAPLGKVYSLLFGPGSSAFMRRWLVENQKSRELDYPEGPGLDNEHKSMSYNYIKPLNGPVGPKQTKCITTCTLTHLNLDRSVSIDCSTQTPDVPSGNVFTVKTRYCLMWGPNDDTRLVATCTIEWTGKSWLKSVIDKASNDGQMEYVNSLVAAVKAALTAKPSPKTPGGRKGRKKNGRRETVDAEEVVTPTSAAPVVTPPNWGPLDPLRQILEPVLGLARPLLSSQVVITVLLLLLTYSWLFPSSRAPTGPAGYYPQHHTPAARLAAYEEIWRREESALWDWLDDRVGGLDAVIAPSAGASGERLAESRAKAMARKVKGDGEGEKMSRRQMDEAIRTTDERLAALREAVARQRSGS